MDRVEWSVASAPVAYPDAMAAMAERCAGIAAGQARDWIWLLEHPPLYTAGTSARAGELLDPRFPVYASGRGGRYTYHGPGQRIVYAMLDLNRRNRDVRAYVSALENWVIAALGLLGVRAWQAPGRVGIWTDDRGREAKIAAIGIRLRRWVTAHGLAINVNPHLADFSGIIPCGLAEYPVTSLSQLGVGATMADVDHALRVAAPAFFAQLGRTP